MAADLDILLREVDDVKQQLTRRNGVDVDSNAIFESLEQNVHRTNRVEFVVRQFLGEDEFNEFIRPEHDDTFEHVTIVNRAAETIDLTIDDTKKKTPLLDTNESILLGEPATVTDNVINLDSESYSSDSSVELLTSQGAKIKRKLATTEKPKHRKKNKNCFDSNVQAISSELSKDASTSNTDDTTYDLCDVNNNDPNNNFEPESSFQQAGAHSLEQRADEFQIFHVPSTSEIDINAPSCSYQPSGSTNASYRCTPEEDFLSDDDADTLQLNNEDLPDQEDIREELLREARFIYNLVPHQHLDEIFSYLEANLDSKDRMNVVLLHFLQRDKQSDQQNQPSLSEKSSSVTANCINSQKAARKTDTEPLVPNPDCNASTYSGETEIYSVSDDESPTIKTKMDTVMNSESVTSADICEMQVPDQRKTSTLLDLTHKTLTINEENEVVQKHITTLTEMFPNMPKQLIEQQCQKVVSSGGSIEELILELIETGSKSEVEEIPQEIVLPGRHSDAGNSSSAVNVNSYPAAQSPVEITNCEEEEEEVEELRYKTLLAIFPDADPDFLREKASILPQDDEAFRNFIIYNLELKGYPTLKDYEERQERAAIKKKYSEEFSVQAFLEVFPDPLNYFKERKASHIEKNIYYGINYLKNKFRWLRMETLKEVYHRHECNLTKAFEELQNLQNSHDKKKKSKEFRLSQRLAADYPKIDELDVPFLQEIAFLDHKVEIDAYLKEKAERRQKAFEEAKENGELLECGCCYDNEVLSEDIRACEEGHLFCKECVKRSAEIAIGEGKTSFSCLASCKSEFSLKVLQSVLKPDIFSKMIKRKQLEEIKQAGIEGLETCPFCDFASIPEEGNKVFQCLNPECMKESCRSCRQVSHIPLRCDEVEKDDEVKMRVYIEDRMTQALVRECWRCKQKFVKADGCNKMKCPCGAMMCYVCRQPVNDYTHFNGQGGTEYHKCPLYSNNDELHITAVEQEGLKAKREVEQLNPDLKLKHDPTRNLPKTKYRCAPDMRNYDHRPMYVYLRNALDRFLFLHHEVRRRRRRRVRVHVEPNVGQMHVRHQIIVAGPDGIEDVHVGAGEDLDQIPRAVINLTANIVPEPPQDGAIDHALIHGADPTNRIQEPPVRPAGHARRNEMPPFPADMPVDEIPLLYRAEQDRRQKNQRRHVLRHSALAQYLRRDAITRARLQLQTRALGGFQFNIHEVPQLRPVGQVIPTQQNVQIPEHIHPGPARQVMPCHQNVQTQYIQRGSARQATPAHQNLQTQCIYPGPARQVISAQQNMQTYEYIQPDCARQAIPGQENMQTPQYIYPGPSRQGTPAHKNVQTPVYVQSGSTKRAISPHKKVRAPQYIQSGSTKRAISPRKKVRAPQYIQPDSARQAIPTHQNVQTPEYVQSGSTKRAISPHKKVRAPEYIQPDSARRAIPTQQNVQTPEYVQSGSTKRAISPHKKVRAPEYIQPDSARRAIPTQQNVQTPEYVQSGSKRRAIPTQQHVQTPEHVQSGLTRQAIPTQNVQTPEYVQPDSARNVRQHAKNSRSLSKSTRPSKANYAYSPKYPHS